MKNLKKNKTKKEFILKPNENKTQGTLWEEAYYLITESFSWFRIYRPK